MNAAASDREALVAPAAASPRTAIEVRGLRKRYGTLDAVRGISFDVQRGEIFGLIGADGAGKTTTFQILAGVMEATGGTAEIFGRPARDARARTGYLTQTFSLYPDLSVNENIRYIGELRRVPSAEIEERGARYLKMFDMDRFSKRLAAQLSGGMKKRAAIARALAMDPEILFFDEPSAGLDPIIAAGLDELILKLKKAFRITIVVVTHELASAFLIADRMILLDKGVVVAKGTPQELQQNTGPRVRQFLDRIPEPELAAEIDYLQMLTGEDPPQRR